MRLHGVLQLKDHQFVEFREAQPADASLVLQMMRHLFLQTNNFFRQWDELSPSVPSEMRKLQQYQQSKNSIFLLVFTENRAIGLAGLDGKPFKRVKHCATLFIGILKEYWRMGLGEQIVSQLIQWAKTQDELRKIELHARAQNFPAIQLYKKLGFREVGTLSDSLYIEGKFEDEVIMELCFPKPLPTGE
ncbi:MAG: GNAT family protein [Planctomycetota bacterium]